MNGTAAIAARYGLRDETVRHFKLHDALHPSVSTGTVIPIIYRGATVACRFKHDPVYAARTGVKAYWLGAGRFDIYNLDAAAAGERVVLAAGEPDAWVLHQAGLLTVSFLKGESCVPREGLHLLVERRPSLVSVIYDLDEAGRAGAERTYRALTEAGVPAEIVDLPADVGHKGDVADLYRLLGHDDAALRHALASLPRRAPTSASAARRAAPSAAPRSAPASGRGLFARLKDHVDIVAIAGRLTNLQPHAGGRYFTGLCPFHDEHHPSFVVWPEIRGFKCMSCGVKGDVITLVQLALDRGLALDRTLA